MKDAKIHNGRFFIIPKHFSVSFETGIVTAFFTFVALLNFFYKNRLQ